MELRMRKKITLRKNLNADALFSLVRSGFEKIKDHRSNNTKISLPDALMSGFAMFSLKDPSLLAFEERISEDTNLKSIYKINNVPCDTQMRTILDEVDPADIEPSFNVTIQVKRRNIDLVQLFMDSLPLSSPQTTKIN